MVTPQEVHKQLNRIDFKIHGWGSAEVHELPHILLPDEQIFEIVNGFYDGGFAILVATDIRVLLVDKKPFNYLTVEDLRFDMINEIDYSHRFIGSNITIATGNRNLVFHSYNKARLRKLIGHVQDCMATAKKQQQFMRADQNQHLEEINQRLQAYLIAQHQHQAELEKRLADSVKGKQEPTELPEAPKIDAALSDYLYAQQLLAEHNAKHKDLGIPDIFDAKKVTQETTPAVVTDPVLAGSDVTNQDLLNDGLREVFGTASDTQNGSVPLTPANDSDDVGFIRHTLTKMPLLLRNRRFGRPSFHDHSQTTTLKPQPDSQIPS